MTDRTLEQRLRRELEGTVRFDPASRGRYSTDASIYQVAPTGVVLPATTADVARTVAIAGEAGLSVTPRGAGTSQSGQSIGPGLIVDGSRHLTRLLELDPAGRRCRVEPGIVLDDLNRELAPHGLWFPVDVATASRATLGGMAGNNSAGARSIQYGLMADNVLAVEIVLADGRAVTVGPELTGPWSDEMVKLYRREAEEFARRIPPVLRHVAGYNLHRLGSDHPNPAEVLVGSEGTLGMFTALDLKLSERPAHRVLGVAHFDTVRAALDATQYVVPLGPSAVELVDHTLIEMARKIPEFQPLTQAFVRGEPGGLLLVEFAGPDPDALAADLDRLAAALGDRGACHTVVRALTEEDQERVWAVRKAGLNIVMSMRGDEKPVSFIEDCAVPLHRLAEYHDRIDEVFARHGTSGTWYAHASVGCLHVRPALNLKTENGAATMRAIAEETHGIVREFGGSHSGEHGDGMIRSEFIEPMLGPRLARVFEQVKDLFDPEGRFNPGKIVRAGRMDDRTQFRYAPGYGALPYRTELDWSAASGLMAAVEMCNNNGACRKLTDGSMCPSYRATRDEIDSTRGRANTLRLALTGQLDAAGLASPAVMEALDLCVGCKACRRECPTGVDMARMKIEVLAQHHPAVRDRLFAQLPRYARFASSVGPLLNTRTPNGWLARMGERVLGIAASRSLPHWSRHPFGTVGAFGPTDGHPVALFVDTFTRYFDPENARAAVTLLTAAGYRVTLPTPTPGTRPACCGRTFLNAGLVREARGEAQRTISAFGRYAEQGIPVVGLEPSCCLTFRDEFPALLPDHAGPLATGSFTLEEFIERERAAGRWTPGYRTRTEPVLVHGHCHQKAFGATAPILSALKDVPGVTPSMIDSSCCGMAGSFGYEREHAAISVRMAERSLAPTVRASEPETVVLADGVSCRHQIHHTTGRTAHHVVRFLADSLADRS